MLQKQNWSTLMKRKVGSYFAKTAYAGWQIHHTIGSYSLYVFIHVQWVQSLVIINDKYELKE
jgi:hypothetical protein